MAALTEPPSERSPSSGVSPHRAPVTVILSTFNRSGLLGEALQTILAQTVRPNRILVIDDGSTDDTASAIEEFREAVEYQRKPNGGKATALNLGLSLTDDPLIWIFDDDDLAAPDALERLTRALQDDPDCGFAYGAYDNFAADPETGKLKRQSVGFPNVASDVLFPALLERCFVFQGGMLVRRSCYDQVGPFDEALVRSQDYEMLLRLARRFRGARVDSIVFHQRQHQGARGTAKRLIRHAEMEAAWRHYDHRIFSKLRGELELAEYLPRGTADASAVEARITALVQRFTVFARKDLWDLALEDFKAFTKLAETSGRTRLTAAEYAMLSRVFDGFSRGLGSFLDADAFRRALGEVQPFSLRVDIRTAMISPLPFRLRRALYRGSPEDVQEAVRAILSLGGPLSVLAWIVKKLAQAIRGSAGSRP